MKDIKMCLLKQRYAVAVGLYTTENYKMPKTTHYKAKTEELLTLEAI
jgi:hypothetical protein